MAPSRRQILTALGRSLTSIERSPPWMNDATKLVFSRTLNEVTWNNDRLVRELDLDEITTLKQRPAAHPSCRSSLSMV